MPNLRRKARRGNPEEIAQLENVVYLHALDGQLSSASLKAKLVARGFNSSDVDTAINTIKTVGKYGQTFKE